MIRATAWASLLYASPVTATLGNANRPEAVRTLRAIADIPSQLNDAGISESFKRLAEVTFWDALQADSDVCDLQDAADECVDMVKQLELPDLGLAIEACRTARVLVRDTLNKPPNVSNTNECGKLCDRAPLNPELNYLTHGVSEECDVDLFLRENPEQEELVNWFALIIYNGGPDPVNDSRAIVVPGSTTGPQRGATAQDEGPENVESALGGKDPQGAAHALGQGTSLATPVVSNDSGVAATGLPDVCEFEDGAVGGISRPRVVMVGDLLQVGDRNPGELKTQKSACARACITQLNDCFNAFNGGNRPKGLTTAQCDSQYWACKEAADTI